MKDMIVFFFHINVALSTLSLSVFAQQRQSNIALLFSTVKTTAPANTSVFLLLESAKACMVFAYLLKKLK